MSAQPALVHDGNYLVTWVPTIADPDAPTVDELTADGSIELQCQVTPDGLKRDPKDEDVDTSRLCSTFSSSQVGRTSFDVELTLVRLDESALADGETDAAYDTLQKGVKGYLVIRDNAPASQDYAVDDEVEVYHVQCGSRAKAAPAANEMQTFTVTFMVMDEPSLNAAVAAGSGV